MYIYLHTCWVAEDLIFSCFMEKIDSDLVLFFFNNYSNIGLLGY